MESRTIIEEGEKKPSGFHKAWIAARYIVADIFKLLLLAYLVLLTLESIEKGFVSFFFNINILLVVVAVFGVLYVAIGMEEGSRTLRKNETRVDLFLFITMGVVAAIITWFKCNDMGNISYLVSIGVGVVLVLVLILTHRSDE